MTEPITASYVQEDDDWKITVSGSGKELTGRAPGIIAARDRADQLVEKLSPPEHSTVVHLLNGSALEFTAAYMTARLTLPEIEPLEVPPPANGKAKDKAAKPPVPQGKELPKAVDEAKSKEKPEPAKTPAKAAQTS
ncbi:hypothetical protein [Amycolatopsis sp. EV170708-02-1]|uniref:hypothetical protein n=1 Tax=Amycolatopsis sp. EV170708-02-1 TaxID=2919322 RepID=UPI001F0C159F|nr:hypothetical protein [Amycolatopsis sp. EV170708-02-1]UMP06458.1 hypothetical protein MJQ72_17320 [Amycolatopsis sp. EV170708-02-1]